MEKSLPLRNGSNMKVESYCREPAMHCKIKYTLENADMGFNKTGVTKIMYDIGFGELNWSDLAATMRRISLENSGE